MKTVAVLQSGGPGECWTCCCSVLILRKCFQVPASLTLSFFFTVDVYLRTPEQYDELPEKKETLFYLSKQYDVPLSHVKSFGS